MTIDVKSICSTSLEELEELQEIIDDRINIIKGEESLRTEPTYSANEMKEYLKECQNK